MVDSLNMPNKIHNIEVSLYIMIMQTGLDNKENALIFYVAYYFSLSKLELLLLQYLHLLKDIQI